MWAATLVCIVAFYLITEISERKPAGSKPDQQRDAVRAVMGAILLSTLFYQILEHRSPFVDVHIYAAPYIWPAGCENKRYRMEDEINRCCGDNKYEIADYRKFGWYDGNSKNDEKSYFRVSNDALLISCRGFAGDDCVVEWLYRDVYHQ